jgi:peptidyl-prolyl cis-trans isomerase D
VLDKSRLLSQVQVSQADLQSYYDQHTDEYRVAEQVNVRHILIKTPTADANGKVDPKGIEDAHQRAADVLKQLKAGGDFSALATKYSEDPGSAKNGGSLGWIVRGRTVPEFEKSAFSLPKGGTSDLVQTSYGFHIIHIDDKQDAHLKSLAEVTPQIAPLIKQQKAEQAAEGQANALVVQVRSQGLDKAAASKGLSVITTDFVAKSDSLPGIGSAPQFMDAVFNAADKAPADEAQIPSGFVIFQLQAIKPAATPTFDEIRSRVESEFKEERSTSLLSQKTQELSDRAKASHDLKKAAKELGASIKSTDGFVKPDAQVQDIGAMSGPANVAFSLKVGDISGPLVNATDGAVLRVTAQQAPSEEEYAQKSDQIRDSLLQGKQQELFGIFVVNLRDQMEKSGKIKINDKELKNLTHAQGGEGEEGD